MIVQLPYTYHSHPSGETYHWDLRGLGTVNYWTQTGELGAAGTGTPTGNAALYFQANPDVAAAYRAEDYGLSANDFAATHWDRFGRAEQRFSPDHLAQLAVRTPAAIAAVYRATVTPGQMTEAAFVQQAQALGISDQFLIEARNIILGRPPGTAWDGTPPDRAPRSGFTLAEKVAALRQVLQSDPTASFENIVAAAAAYGIREPEVREAYAELLRERQASATPTTTTTPTTTSTPITAYLPPGWTQGPGTGALLDVPRTITTVAPSVPTTFRDLESTGYGGIPIPPAEGGGIVGPMPPVEGRAGLPLPLLAAGAAVAAFFLMRR